MAAETWAHGDAVHQLLDQAGIMPARHFGQGPGGFGQLGGETPGGAAGIVAPQIGAARFVGCGGQRFGQGQMGLQ
jgi:hypothetical protein